MAKTLSKAPDMLERARAIHADLSAVRRAIHARPELSFQERETALMVAAAMKELGYEVSQNIGGEGVVAQRGEGRTIAIRADMDALPIQEADNGVYRSQTKGVMHACGHDVHTSCALGAARLLASLFEEGAIGGRIRFLFQPAEETINEEGKSGAVLMLEEGAIENVDALIGLHVDPKLPAGKIAVRQGALLAACDSFNITVRGRSCHGAQPEQGIDAIILASQIVQSLQTVISRRKSPLQPAVLTIGGIKSATYRPNVVAAEVELTGTLRYFDQSVHDMALQEINNICSIASVFGGSFELDYVHDTPALYNDEAICALVSSVGRQLLGTENVVNIDPQLGADDFSHFTAHVPSCYLVLGACIEESPRDLHTPTFDIDEAALPVGAAILAQTALAFLDPR